MPIARPVIRAAEIPPPVPIPGPVAAVQLVLSGLELAGVIPNPLSLLTALFSGRPKMQATADIASSLLRQRNPALRLLGIGATKLVQDGIAISSPDASRIFGPYFERAVLLETQARFPNAPNAQNNLRLSAETLQSALHEAGNPGQGNQTLNALNQRGLVARFHARPPVPVPPGPPVPAPPLPGPPMPQPGPFPNPSPTPSTQPSLTSRALSVFEHALPFEVRLPIQATERVNLPAQVEMLDELVPQGFKSPERIGESIGRLITGQSETQPELAPIMGEQYCAECDPTGRGLVRQQQELQREIETETRQQQQQQIQQQQQEIERLKGLERQPPSTRDIPKEIAQKQALLDQIARELSDIQAHQQGQQPSTSPLTPSADLPPMFGQETEPASIPGQQSLPPIEKPVIFCVGCQSQNDAFRFLNGEPSACSVIPDKGDAYVNS